MVGFLVVLLGELYFLVASFYIVETCFDDRLKACLAYMATQLTLRSKPL